MPSHDCSLATCEQLTAISDCFIATGKQICRRFCKISSGKITRTNDQSEVLNSESSLDKIALLQVSAPLLEMKEVRSGGHMVGEH